jgi:hypothetical protein
MVNLVFIAGLVIGWIVAGRFIRPFVSKFFTQDLNTLVKNNPMLKSNIQMQLSPAEIQMARMQGFMV